MPASPRYQWSMGDLRPLVAVAIVLLSIGGCGTAPSPVPATASGVPVQAPPNPQLVEFEGHLAEAITRQGQLVRDLAAASTGSSGQLGLVARQLEQFAADELAWLDEHDGDPCYEEATAAFTEGLNSIRRSARLFSDLATASPPPSDTGGQAAGQALSEGTSSLGQAATLAKSARATCRRSSWPGPSRPVVSPPA